MPTRDEIYGLLVERFDKCLRHSRLTYEDKFDLLAGAADAILALDWTEPGLRRAVEIVRKHEIAGDESAEVAGWIAFDLEAEINGNDDG